MWYHVGMSNVIKQIHIRFYTEDRDILNAVDEQVTIGVPISQAIKNLMRRGLSSRTVETPVTAKEVRQIIETAISSLTVVSAVTPSGNSQNAQTLNKLRKGAQSMVYKGE